MLRCKTAQMVRKEVAVHLLAYNLIRTLTAQAAHLARVLPQRVRFKAALQTLDAFDALAESEARYLARTADADTVRNRIAAAAQAGNRAPGG